MTIETSPDKKMGVGSLRNPRECDGRLPPDAGYYLDLVLPRKEEPPKKTGGRVRLSHGRILQIQRSTYKPIKPRISVNLLVISVKILVNLLVKLTRSGLGGGHRGPGLQGLTNSRCSACSSLCCSSSTYLGVGPKAQRAPWAPLPGGGKYSRRE